MEKYSKQLLQNIYISLPQELKEAIFSVENAEKIQQIAQRYQISQQKIPYLASIAGRVLLTVLAIEKLIGSLESELKIDRNTAEKIAKDIKQTIIQPVMPILTKIQQESFQKNIPKSSVSKPALSNIVNLKENQ